MDERRRMAWLVMSGEVSVSEAARAFGVSRPTVREWVRRARADGLEHLTERSRRPVHSPQAAPAEVVDQVLGLAAMYEDWGARKLWHLLGGPQAPVCSRTVDRILQRAGRRLHAPSSKQAPPLRFERETPNELWQMDFKRLGPRRAVSIVLSVLDDASRFSLAVRRTPNETYASVWACLWELFGEFGLPGAILSDNGPAFRCNATWRFSRLDLDLMLLGVRSIHGRPYHPQTQGKVERFHRSLQWELGRKVTAQTNLDEALETFRARYNWVRPHESQGMCTPGQLYMPSTRLRPSRLPEPFFPERAIVRRADSSGYISFKGQRYDLGNAFAGRDAGIVQDENGTFFLAWAGRILTPLSEFQTGKDVLS